MFKKEQRSNSVLEKSDYLDHIVLEILNLLSKNDSGLRYNDLKTKLNVSDTSLVQRLNKLKSAEYIAPEAKISDTGRNYIAYILTDFGVQLIKELNIPKLLEKIDEQLAD